MTVTGESTQRRVGTGGSAETDWSHLFDRLGASRTVVAPDDAGSGETSRRR